MITIRHRAPGQADWSEREFYSDAEAAAFVKALPSTTASGWGGQAERPDPPLASKVMANVTITFGLVSAALKVLAATEESAPKLHQFCAEHGTPVRNRRMCEHGEGHELRPDEIVRGIEGGGETPATLTDAELAELRASHPAKAIDVEEFVPARTVPASYFDRTYYLAPGTPAARRPYELLAAVLQRSATVAIAMVAFREGDRPHLCMVRAERGRLVLVTLRWAEEVRSDAALPNLAGEAVIDPAELEVARQLVRAKRRKAFDAYAHRDPYAAALNAKLDAAVEVVTPAAPDQGVVVTGLMERLTASVEEAKRRPRRKAAAQ